jgi:periplasmic divalent cation tolerance protein
MKFVLVTTTFADRESADAVAALLVERSLAACVQVLPGITSIYRWRGAVEKEQEVLLIIKTRADLVQKIGRLFDEHHPYEVPELISMEIVDGSAGYVQWLSSSLAEGGPDR